MSKFIKSVICIVSTCVLFLGGCSNVISEKEVKSDKEGAITSSKSIENNDDSSNKEKVVVPLEEIETNENTESELIKQSYLRKLDELDANLKISLKEKYASPVTLDMIEASNEELKQWDDMLNEIYAKLEKQLSKEEMDKLRGEELKWIESRDKKSEEARSEFAGGSIEPFMGMQSLVESTKTRCYELVNEYMK